MFGNSFDRDAVWVYVYDYLDESGLDDCDYDVAGWVDELADFMEANGIGSCCVFPRDIFEEMLGAYEC